MHKIKDNTHNCQLSSAMIVYQSRIYLNCKGGEQQSINFPTTAAVVSSRSIMTAAASTAPSVWPLGEGGAQSSNPIVMGYDQRLNQTSHIVSTQNQYLVIMCCDKIGACTFLLQNIQSFRGSAHKIHSQCQQICFWLVQT